jgi:Putative beta-lactamase-inhibitor-like, PepSY-like
MKKLFLVMLSMLGIFGSIFANDVPKAVADAFAKKFPAATNIKWAKENAKEYEAEFKLNGKSISANFLTDGSWVETESAINASELPAPVTAVVKSQYPDAVILKIFKIETATGKITYETEFKTGNKKKELIFNAEGNVVK